jgi:hypothetical protein
MPNQYVLNRLVGIQNMLRAVHQAGTSMTAASKGTERQSFIDSFLSNVLPPVYRFGSGDATDAAGRRSGQLDVVVEYPFSPSLPSFGTAAPTRLYLAEAVAAVIEVKSDVAAQWAQANQTANQLAPLRRTIGAAMTMGGLSLEQIPLFVAGYTGWSTLAALEQNLLSSPDIAGVLVIDAGLFVSSASFGSLKATGPWALWGLITCLHHVTNSLQAASTDPSSYAI